MPLLFYISSPNSEKWRAVPFSRANHSGFALNTILILDLLNYTPPFLSKGPFPLVHKTCTLFSLIPNNPFPDDDDDDNCNGQHLLKSMGQALHQDPRPTEPFFLSNPKRKVPF